MRRKLLAAAALPLAAAALLGAPTAASAATCTTMAKLGRSTLFFEVSATSYSTAALGCSTLARSVRRDGFSATVKRIRISLTLSPSARRTLTICSDRVGAVRVTLLGSPYDARTRSFASGFCA